MGSIDKFLNAVARGRPAEALGLQYPYTEGDIRRAVATYHPDRGGDTELSALANACAEALRARRPLDELYCRTASKLLSARIWEEVQREYEKSKEELQRRRKLLPQQKAKRACSFLEPTQRAMEACAEVPFLHATPFKTLCDVMQTALGLQRRVVEIILSDAGVSWHKNGRGHRVAAREGHGIQLTSEARTILGELAASRVAG
jgi:hypothetical protein